MSNNFLFESETHSENLFSLKKNSRNDFNLVFGVDIQLPLSKADRIIYGESGMTHAMVITAVSLDDVRNFRGHKNYFAEICFP